jgi:hypothetical protein
MADLQNFFNSYIDDLNALGFTRVTKRIPGPLGSNYLDIFTRGDIQILIEGGILKEIRVGTRADITEMGKDNLSNTKLRDIFKAIDVKGDIMSSGPGVGPSEMVDFKYWRANIELGLNIPFLFQGESKESTPFYTQIYPDIVKLTQVSDTYKNFNELSFKDQLKQVGKEFKSAIFPKKREGTPINETENLSQAEQEVKTLSTDIFESKPKPNEGDSPLNPALTESEEIVKSSETIESRGPSLEGQIAPNSVPTSEDVINPAKEEVKAEATGSQSGTTNITNYNTSTVNETVINQNNTQNNIDDRKEINNSEVTNVSELGGGTAFVNPVNEVVEEKKTESSTEEVEDVGPVLNTPTAANVPITAQKVEEVSLDDFLDPEYLEATNAYFGKSSMVNNPVNSSNVNVSESNNEKSESNTELNSTLNEISNNLTTNTNTLNAVSNNASAAAATDVPITAQKVEEVSLDDFLDPEYLEATNAYFGKSSETTINSDTTEGDQNMVSNVANESINTESVTSNMTEVNTGSGELEVNKTPVGLDKAVAPINTVNNTSTKVDSPVQNKSEETKIDASSNPSEMTSSVTSETIVSNETNNQNMNEGSSTTMNSSSIGGSMPIDLSEVASRLRRLEDLLSGPLEVRVIN